MKEAGACSYDVSGIIGFSGNVTGTVILSFPSDVAVELVGRFVGARIAKDNPDFADAVGELVNMVAGNAKSKMARKDVQISCPTVVMGNDYRVMQRKSVAIIVIPCHCDAGVFETEVSLRAAEAEKSSAEKQAALAG
jgi:chemotaxis protein CheX